MISLLVLYALLLGFPSHEEIGDARRGLALMTLGALGIAVWRLAAAIAGEQAQE